MAEQVSATIVQIGTKAPLPSPLTISFPTENVTIEAVTDSAIANSVITYNKVPYYATETQSDLVTAANSGGGGGPTIYTGDGSLTGDRTIDLAGHLFDIKLSGAANAFLHINPLINNEALYLLARNVTGDGNAGGISGEVSDTTASAFLESVFNDGVHEAWVHTFADATSASVDYRADLHTFNGVINLPVQSAPVSPNDGDVWRQDNTNTGLKIRVNGVTKTITLS